MEYVLRSGGYEAAVSDKGAELKRFLSPEGKNCIWCGDAAVWGKTSPILFPFVGTCRNGVYRTGGKEYPMRRHGFARDNTFIYLDGTENTASFELTDTAETQKIYPFRFSFVVRYTLKGARLAVSFEVQNRSDGVLYYALGGHTAFSTETMGADMTEYQVVFDRAGAYETRRLDVETGLLSGRREPVCCGKTLPLSPSLFEGDALIFETIPVRSMELVHKKTGRGVRFGFENFDSLGIWAALSTSRFVCLEPWTTLPDSSSWDGELGAKDGIRALNAGETASHAYSIEFLKA